MRIKGEKQSINYEDTGLFFKHRAKRYSEDNPYSVTMYQDDHPELVKRRNEKEVEVLLPKLELRPDSKVLDIACGIGRWADAIECNIKEYCGVDFCEDLIDLARKRNMDMDNRFFLVGRSTEIEDVLRRERKENYNRVLFIGALMYLNDEDIMETLSQTVRVCEQSTIICIREPIGIEERLTLKKQFSDELGEEYSAIYRTRDELVEIFETALINKGFVIDEENYLFEDGLNNRKETRQYYFVLKRQ